jgi:hypothetical protein
MNYFTIRFSIAIAVIYIPAKGFKEWVDKILSCQRFVVFTFLIRSNLLMEAINK